jgi:predicted methyltransferase
VRANNGSRGAALSAAILRDRQSSADRPVLADKVRNDGSAPGGEGVLTLGSDPLARPHVMVKIVEPAKLKAATTYNAAADHFDDGPLAFWDRYGRRTIEGLALSPGSTVLDVGCGSGASAIPAAQRVGPNGHVIGVDLAERLLAMARAKAVEQRLENIELRESDMEALGSSSLTMAVSSNITSRVRAKSMSAWHGKAN